MDELPRYDERVLLLAPTRRDADVTLAALKAAGLHCDECDDLPTLASALELGAGALMFTELALCDARFPLLLDQLDRQPAWSNLPTIVLCRDRERPPVALCGLDRLRNLVLLDRPTSMRSMTSAVQSALRGRRWQYQIRDQLVAQRLAKEALRQADQRKDQFLATLSHELRNPLAAVHAGLQVLRRQPARTVVGPDAPRLFGMMERQLSQLVRLVDELLDVSRITTGKIVLRRERIDLRSVISHALEVCQPALEAGAQRVQVALPADEVPVYGDASRLSQALQNLIDNAARYTPAGGRIALSLVHADSEAVVSVSDSGVGIPPSMLEQVFDLFAQVDRTGEQAQGGLGIGLSLVRNLVELHGGTVTARSAGTDQGSEFVVRLPAAPWPPALATGPRAGDDALPRPQRPLRVLVVDDNADAADTLAMLLGLNGHRVQVEYGAVAALKTARELLPEIIFCDLAMPGMNGHDFARCLRQDPRFATTLLIAVTGWGTEDARRRSRAAGFDDHLVKPASIEAIEAILSRR